MLTNEQIESIVAQYDRSVAGDQAAVCYGVSERLDVGDGAQLVQVLYGDDKQWTDSTAVVVYDTGDVFCLNDWTLGPFDREGIADYEWVHAQTGKRAVILDGLPRVI